MPCALPATGGRDLATVLSSLQRASGLSLRTRAGSTELSPSFLSRVMSGERFPSWRHACSIARACGADPEVLRRVWESSNARRDNQPPPSHPRLRAALPAPRAGSPTLWAISVTTGIAVSPTVHASSPLPPRPPPGSWRNCPASKPLTRP
ncbi:helix-turn-helix domain-containing protein [Streptomyces lancefieldiae]|uniref:helix-turn-helix domain-containing protein n=1 Tax=Streptomyces lancefieldiae TaxID=3075520 RepID=UPI00374E03B5